MKRKKIIQIIVASLVILAIITAGVLYSRGIFSGSQTGSSVSYTVEKLLTGDIEKSISGTGTLAAGGTATEVAPIELAIETVTVKTGQDIKAGDMIATIDTDVLADAIAIIQADIDTVDTKIAQQLSSEVSAAKLTSPVAGRIKKIHCAVGDNVDAVMSDLYGLFLLSTDGKMKVDISLETEEIISAGTEVTVKTESNSYTGLIESITSDDKSCTVTLTDNGPALGAEVDVYTTTGTKLGSGTLEVNRPYLVAASSGSVSNIYVSLNEKINTRTALAYIVGIPVSDTYIALEQTRAKQIAKLEVATAIQTTGFLAASQDGTVKTIMITDGQVVKQDGPLITLSMTDTFSIDVSVDELDINSVSVGQIAAINVEAASGKAFAGTVESVSQIGVTSNGVTNYTVVIKMVADASLKIGMNATVTIVIEKHTGVLLLPLTALQSLRGSQYVWLYTGTLPKDSSQNPGTYTEVQTGLSNSNFVEITSGLEASDQVVVVRTTSSNDSSAQQQNGMFYPGMNGDNQRIPNGSNEMGGEPFGPPAGR
jgi:HlyD family secretion protein